MSSREPPVPKRTRSRLLKWVNRPKLSCHHAHPIPRALLGVVWGVRVDVILDHPIHCALEPSVGTLFQCHLGERGWAWWRPVPHCGNQHFCNWCTYSSHAKTGSWDIWYADKGLSDEHEGFPISIMIPNDNALDLPFHERALHLFISHFFRPTRSKHTTVRHTDY